MQTLFLESAIRATLIAAVIALVLFAMRIKTASVLHAVWSSVVVLMMLLPAWVAWGPKASLPVLPSAATIAPLDFVPPPSPAGLAERSSISSASPVRQDGGYALLESVYLLGVCALLFRLVIGTVRANRLTSAACVVPVTVGLLHPRIILPECSHEWPQAQLQAVLSHEGEHVRRRDPLFQWIALLNRAIFWFHPLAWWLERKLSGLAEEACDAIVIARGYDPREYSEYLLDLARSVQRAGTRIDAVGMAMPGIGLRYRIGRMLSGVPVPRISRLRMACTVAVCASAAAILAAGTLIRAQQQSTPRPAFEVASIKVNNSVDRAGRIVPSPGGVTAQNISLKALLAFAYEMRSDLIFGPGWIDSSKYDIAAKAAARVSLSEMKLMLQTLLKERFHVTVHGETRELAVYALVVGKGGPKGLRQPAQSSTRGLELQNTTATGTKHWAFHDSSMQNLAGLMSGGMDRPLVDLTGLQGRFDFAFDEPAWDRENTTLAEYTTELVWPAVQDQLGIRVEPRKAPMDVLVIDHAEQPSEN